jgi:autotransporter-associated beta strand protein
LTVSAGRLTLTGANAYTGGTTITGGTLLANGQTGTNSGTGTGAVTVNVGGLLGGNGRVSGPVTAAGGTVQAGQGTVVNEQLTLGGDLILGNNSKLRAVVGNGAVASDTTTATGSSQFAVNGSFGRSAPTDLVAIELVVPDPGSFDQTGGTGYTRRVVSNYVFLANLNTGTYTQADGVFAVSTTGLPVASNWQVLVGPGGNTIDVVFTPVPEPASILLLCAAAGLLARRIRNRMACRGSLQPG